MSMIIEVKVNGKWWKVTSEACQEDVPRAGYLTVLWTRLPGLAPEYRTFRPVDWRTYEDA